MDSSSLRRWPTHQDGRTEVLVFMCRRRITTIGTTSFAKLFYVIAIARVVFGFGCLERAKPLRLLAGSRAEQLAAYQQLAQRARDAW